MLFLREKQCHFFRSSIPAPVEGGLGLISEMASVTILMTRLKHQHVAEEPTVTSSKRPKLNFLCLQVEFQHQPQFPRIDLRPDPDQHPARQGRYAVLFELQICMSHELVIWEKNWKRITFVMSLAGCVEGLVNILS